MKKAILMFTAVLGLSAGAFAESGLLWEITGGLWVAPDAEGYQVWKNDVVGEEYDSSAAFNMDAKLGYQWDMDHARADLSGLLGWYAGPVLGVDFGVDGAYCFKVGEKGGFGIGPHVALKYMAAPTWIGDYDDYVEFDGTPAGVVGLKMTIGSRRVKGVVLIDYIAAEFDAKGKNGGSVSSSTLDMSGFMISGGVQF